MARATGKLTRCIAGATIALLAFASPAFAGKDDFRRYLTAAERLYYNLENERALEQLQRAKEHSSGAEDDALVSLYEGTILLDLGRKEQGMAAYRTALLLVPTAKLPMKVSPKILREFEGLRAAVDQELAPIRARREAEARQLAEAKRAEEQQRQQAEAARAKDPAVAQKSGTELPKAAMPSVPQSPTAKKGPKVLPFVVSGAAVAAATVGAVFGFMAQQQYGEAKAATFQDDRVKLSGQANQSATVANVLFGAASVTAVGAAITFAL